MNTLTRSLAAFCRAHPGDEKWLIAPNVRVGHQWIDSVAASGTAVLNLQVFTLRNAALQLALPSPDKPQLEILRSLDALLLCGSLFQAGQKRSDNYLLSLPPSLSLLRRLARLLEELRLAGLDAGDLASGKLENRHKATELAGLLISYASFLEREKLTDYPELLRLAAAAAYESGQETPWLLLPGETELCRLERDFLMALPAGRVVTLDIDQAENGYGWELGMVEDFRFPAPPEPGMEIVRAAGEANEIRQALRHILSSGIPLDQVELVHTHRETYVPLIYEVLKAAVPDGEPPVTFADGVPSRLTRPGRALDLWLRWVESGYERGLLIEMVSGGLLVLPENCEVRPSYLAAVLERLPVYGGKERWREVLNRELRRARHCSQPGDEDDDGETGGRTNKRELAALGLLQTLVSGLLEFSPEPGRGGKELAVGACRLLEHHAAHVNELDTYARRAMLEQAQDLIRWLERHGDGGFDTASYLAEVAVSVPVMGNAPQPGKLHVSGIAAGGHTGRPLTVIVGLDDSRWPPSDSQNPLLLDSERVRLSPGLTTAADSQMRAIREFELLLSRLRGRVVLSFPSSDPLQDRESFPSPLLLPVYRKMSGDSVARQKQMLAALDPPGSFAPADPQHICRVADWWLAAMLALPPDKGWSLLEQYFPHLAAGETARRMRLSDRFSEYDGFLAAPGPELDPFGPEGPVFSASGLKTMGECPRRYFYRYVLDLDEPREAPPLSQWLDAAQAGQLLHEVLFKFLVRLSELNELPQDSGAHRTLLAEISEKSLLEFREKVPVPGEAAFQARKAWLEQALRTFLVQEAEYCHTHLPRWLEASIGIKTLGEHSKIGCDQPVPLAVPGGTVRVRGRVDRIDRLADSLGYTITDYKSGGSGSYNLAAPFDGGRRVQHALYLAMVRRRLEEIEPGADVPAFRYFFPAGSERGESKQWSAGELSRGAELVGLLAGISRDGAFAATDDVDKDCKYCAFKQLCGDLEAQAEAGERKRLNPANTVLRSVAGVREYA